MKSRIIVIILFVLILHGCEATEPFRTLPEGKHQITLCAGFQNINIDNNGGPSSIIPYGSIGFFYGISDNFTLGGNFYPLLLLGGLIGFDAGGLIRLVKQNGAIPEFDFGLKIYIFPSTVLPAVRIPISSRLSQNFSIFVNPEILYRNDYSATWLFTPSMGFALHSTTIQFQVEFKWLALGSASNSSSKFQWNTTGNNIGLFVGIFFGNTGSEK